MKKMRLELSFLPAILLLLVKVLPLYVIQDCHRCWLNECKVKKAALHTPHETRRYFKSRKEIIKMEGKMKKRLKLLPLMSEAGC